MNGRRNFLRTLALGLVALSVVVAPAIADELIGVITKVDVSAKKITVLEKGTDKRGRGHDHRRHRVRHPEEDRQGQPREASEERHEANRRGQEGRSRAKVTHDKGVASSISVVGKKAAN